MGYAVVHMMKIKSGAVGGIQSHNNREHEPKTNPDVDMSRSEDNYDLIPCEYFRYCFGLFVTLQMRDPLCLQTA